MKLRFKSKEKTNVANVSVENSTIDLYQGCLTDGWCMNDSERMGLIALLEKIKPKCCIEVGTFLGGSLSLIAQYAEEVYSIDIDETIPKKLSQFKNVKFLSGYSSELLPNLIKDLDSQGKAIDFILIDGDHSYEGVKGDINIIQSYVPKTPMFLVMHDSFNPECRQGMIDAEWDKMEYTKWIDLDFIPGRVVNVRDTDKQEMWGGLAFAYFEPKKREGNLEIKMQAKTTFEELKKIYYKSK